MLHGDISNQVGSAVVINADLLGSIETKYFGFKKKFVPFEHIRSILTPLFENLNVYIVCQLEYEPMLEKLEAHLDNWYIPYTRIYRVESGNQLEELVGMEHVVAYVYAESSHHKAFSSVEKHFKIPHLLDIYWVLSGRGNKWQKK